MRWHQSLTLLVVVGCPDSGASQPPRETAAQVALRQTMERALERTGSVSFASAGPIPDGGSWIFTFKTDGGMRLDLLVLHGREDWGGSPDFQVIRICSPTSNEECEVYPSSPLESHLLRLLNSASIVPDKDPGYNGKPNRQRLQWLVGRIVDRRASRTPVPTDD